MIHLNDMLALGATVSGNAHATHFDDFSYDSRRTQPGELFLAIQTTRADGHDYIPAAVAAGATGVLCAWQPHHTINATVILSDAPAALVQQWAHHRLRHVGATTIAVAGSVGKTSTKHVIAALLSSQAPTFASQHSFNSLLGVPIAMARLHDEHRYAVLEFGSDHIGEIAHLVRLFPPTIGVVTAIGNVYLSSFGSQETIAHEKTTLVTAIPPHGWAILNGDDTSVNAMQSHAQCHVVCFGQHAGVHLQARAVVLSLHDTRFQVVWHGHEAIAAPPMQVTVRVPLIGEPAVPVVLAAMSVALVCGIPLQQQSAVLQHIAPLPGRLHPLRAAVGATIIDDTFEATHPSLMASLRTVQALPAARRFVVLGELSDGTTDRTSDYHDIGTLAGSFANKLICKGDWGTTVIQAARAVQPHIASSVVYTATDVLHALPDDLSHDDIVLVKGSSAARMEQVVAGLLAPELDATTRLVRQEAVWRTVRVGTPDRPTAARIDMNAVSHNIRRLRHIAAVPVMAVIKADAYGHGAIRVARTALASGATALAVATLSEARTLRLADITAPILILGYTPPWQAHEAVQHHIQCAIFDHDVARALSDAAVALQRRVTVHVKVDTGMGRLGMLPNDTGDFLAALKQLPHLDVEGIYSHFATADSSDETYARQQLLCFQALLVNITAAGLRPPIVHMANSAALLRFPQARFDMVRPGIACYGLNPSNDTPLPPDFRPVLTFHTELAQVKHVPAGVSLSYGGIFTTQRESLIATIPVGYADGFRRSPPWREVLVRGKRVPIVGRICMDYALLDVTGIAGVKRGDPVVLIGSQEGSRITADEVARWLGTINYEVVSAILPRVPREVGE